MCTRLASALAQGDVVFHVEDGKKVGYKVGDESIVYFNDLPEVWQDDATNRDTGILEAMVRAHWSAGVFKLHAPGHGGTRVFICGDCVCVCVVCVRGNRVGWRSCAHTCVWV